MGRLAAVSWPASGKPLISRGPVEPCSTVQLLIRISSELVGTQACVRHSIKHPLHDRRMQHEWSVCVCSRQAKATHHDCIESTSPCRPNESSIHLQGKMPFCILHHMNGRAHDLACLCWKVWRDMTLSHIRMCCSCWRSHRSQYACVGSVVT